MRCAITQKCSHYAELVIDADGIRQTLAARRGTGATSQDAAARDVLTSGPGRYVCEAGELRAVVEDDGPPVDHADGARYPYRVSIYGRDRQLIWRQERTIGQRGAGQQQRARIGWAVLGNMLDAVTKGEHTYVRDQVPRHEGIWRVRYALAFWDADQSIEHELGAAEAVIERIRPRARRR
jgi:hypothetical protein